MDVQAINQCIETMESQLRLLRSMLCERMQTTAPIEAIKKQSEGRCLNCGDKFKKSDRVVRGCHERCHQQITRAIRDGLLTDTDAVTQGIWAPPKKSGRPRKPDTELNRILAKKQPPTFAEELSEVESEFDSDMTAALAKESAKRPAKKTSKRKAN